ncbi:hypothetical protein [Kistimonas asteriae]|uniref:hypothetical protein n=1 Tax=Kistimonas asteriae TaxID=517724 RepID=UPI001BA6EF0B|nr:hypothetical protein [Kistimonas asteriae]
MKPLFPLLLMLSLTGCSAHTWWPDVDSEAICANKWKPEGHINTTHIVATMAGVPEYSAERYALYSQVPDAQWFRFSAPAVSVWATLVPWEWDYRYEVNAILHSLHGGNQEQITERRSRLVNEINDYARLDLRENDWKVGFLIHALGDSYAHVYQRNPQSDQQAYGPAIGHVVSKGIYSADSIQENMENYLAYIHALYDALNTGNGNQNKLYNLKHSVDYWQTKDDAYIAGKIAEFNISDSAPIHYCEHQEWAKEVTKQDVSLFLKELKHKLREDV